MLDYLVPGFLVQVYAVVQWDSFNQLHCQHPGARELTDHFWHLEKGITLQKGSEGRSKVSDFQKDLVKQLTQSRVTPLHTPEALGTLGLPPVVALPGQLPLKNLQAAVGKQTCGGTRPR